jgi:hypothetical protein
MMQQTSKYPRNKHTNKQTDKQTNKQTNKQNINNKTKQNKTKHQH